MLQLKKNRKILYATTKDGMNGRWRWKIPCAATKTWHSQINKYILKTIIMWRDDINIPKAKDKMFQEPKMEMEPWRRVLQRNWGAVVLAWDRNQSRKRVWRDTCRPLSLSTFQYIATASYWSNPTISLPARESQWGTLQGSTVQSTEKSRKGKRIELWVQVNKRGKVDLSF